MKYTSILSLCLFTFSFALQIHGMKKLTYKEIADPKFRRNNESFSTTHKQQKTQKHWREQVVYNPPQKTPQKQTDNLANPKTLLQNQPHESKEEKEDELYIPFQDSESASEEEQERVRPPIQKPENISIDIKTIERLALMADMLPQVLKRNAETIITLEKKLLEQNQTHNNTLENMQLHHNQQAVTQKERHLNTLNTVHEKFDAQMLAKQEEHNKKISELAKTYNQLIEAQTASYNNIMQTVIHQNQLLYALCIKNGIIQPQTVEQIEQNNSANNNNNAHEEASKN